MQRLGDLLAEGMGFADACPATCDNTQPPDASLPRADGWINHYRCADCGQTWTREWRR